MVYVKNHLIELVIIIFIFGAGMLLLNNEFTTTKRLTDSEKRQVLKENDLYPQYNTIMTDNVSDEELCTMIMGYREYPIIIDGVTMDVDEENGEDYLKLIKPGYYKKSYQTDVNNNVTQIQFAFIGGL